MSPDNPFTPKKFVKGCIAYFIRLIGTVIGGLIGGLIAGLIAEAIVNP
jgi:hypothetical protein